jgi:phosphohistidine phosphatase
VNKELILIRHAEALPGRDDDFNRQLTARGIADAHQAALQIRLSSSEAVIVSSPAIRAYSTALIVASSLNFNFDRIQLKSALYNSDLEEYLEAVRTLNNQFQTAIIIGHNPSISQLASYFGDGEVQSLQPGGMVRLLFGDISWGAISRLPGNDAPVQS